MDPASCEILEKELENLSKTEKSISGTFFPIMPEHFLHSPLARTAKQQVFVLAQ